MMDGEAGIHMTPKFHLMLHLAVNGARTGVNPYCHSTFIDEDFNGRLKALACKAHRLNWHKRVLADLRWAYTDANNFPSIDVCKQWTACSKTMSVMMARHWSTDRQCH